MSTEDRNNDELVSESGDTSEESSGSEEDEDEVGRLPRGHASPRGHARAPPRGAFHMPPWPGAGQGGAAGGRPQPSGRAHTAPR